MESFNIVQKQTKETLGTQLLYKRINVCIIRSKVVQECC